MKSRKLLSTLLLIFIIACTSCSQERIPITEDTNISNIIPTADSETAVIYGVILNSDTKKPVSGVPHLAHILISENPDIPQTVSFSLQSDPGANYDPETGMFYFENIKPGENYAIILIYGPGTSKVVTESVSEDPIHISVSAGEMLNLGELSVREP